MGTQALNGKTSVSETYSNLGLVEEGRGVSGPPQVLSLISSVIERTIQKNEKLLKASAEREVITIFHGSRAPALSIQRYIERIFKYSGCSTSSFVVAYIYINKLLQWMNVYLTSLNIHRLLITSVMLAAKFLDDECHNNAYYAKIGGISTTEMNELEMKFLFGMAFRLHVTVETFDKYCLELEEEAKGKYQIDRSIRVSALRRSWTNKDARTIAGYTCKAT
ncbi:hypothetical protein F0562_019887 [Nyssa sinensis]|uniref:Cyclin n=1 Tax=Nyssa sinensis TaxID=561372 RepID=A0A5J5BPM4_9ASTE|nr:hypothetical protein F0562_019887 [Nyssa sinensis]